MKNKIAKITAIVLAVLMVAALTACGGGAQQAATEAAAAAEEVVTEAAAAAEEVVTEAAAAAEEVATEAAAAAEEAAPVEEAAEGSKDVVVVGIDGNLIALNSIKEGKIYGSAYDWSLLQGYLAVYQAIDLIEGKEVPEETLTADVVINADNVDFYYPHCEELDAWKIGDPIDGVSEYMNGFIDEGLKSVTNYKVDRGAVKDKGYTLGIVVKVAANAHFQDICYGAQIAAYETGCTLKSDYCNTEMEVLEQVQKCEDMVSSGVDALMLTANDTKGVSAAVEAAHDAGIPFVTIDTEIVNDWGDKVKEYLPCFIHVDHELMSSNLAKSAFERVGNEGNVVVMRGNDAASSSIERTAGFKSAIEETAGMVLVDEQTGEYDQDKAAQKMADMLQGNAKDVDVVLCCNDLMACGVQTALEENGYTVSPR